MQRDNAAQPLVTAVETGFKLLVVLIFTRARDVIQSEDYYPRRDDVRDSPGTKDNRDRSINLYSELRPIL